MNNSILQETLKEFQIPDFIRNADNATLARMIASFPSEDTRQPTPEKLPRYALIYERRGIRACKALLTLREDATKAVMYGCFQNAYICWRTLLFLSSDTFPMVIPLVSSESIRIIEADIHGVSLPPELLLAFRLSVAGLMSERTAETRLDLKCFSLDVSDSGHEDWRRMVAEHIFSAFVRLVRKDNGWQDIQSALQMISTLSSLQKDYEVQYLDSLPDPEQQAEVALDLVGLYHLAQLIILVGEYLRTGQGGNETVNTACDHHYELAVAAFDEGQHTLLVHLSDLLWIGCRELVQNAIWTHVEYLGEHTRQYVQMLTSSVRSIPVIELWPGQQEAFRRHLLDVYQRAIIVEMPTSAGKTLLAKFAILQTKALNPHGLVAYVAPTRALVNQITCDLRQDFRSMLHVEQTVPAFEPDPTEERLLKSWIDVLVTTPEKLDLLVKNEHPVVKNIALVVADEAHNIGDGERGTRLELLLGTIKRDFVGARFLLLSPFLPDPQDLVQWLGEERSLPPISISWKPNRKLVGSVRSVRYGDQWVLEFETFESAHAMDIRAGMKIPIGLSPLRLSSVHALSRATAQALMRRGSVLILCSGPHYAVNRARQIADECPLVSHAETLDAACHYIDAELGHDSDLVHCLRHGVAYHHSGLSHETRWLVEELIRSGLVKVVCGTTTLAQGMNFPITTVIIESLSKGRSARISFENFWNIAGRAGRTLVDSLGVVAFPIQKDKKQAEFAAFLKEDAQEIARHLATLIEQAEHFTSEFDVQLLEDNPQLSPLLQFLAHAMRLAGSEDLSAEVEELLHASFIYQQIQKKNRAAADRLVKICRSYIEQTSHHKDILKLADRTGFATPSVLSLLTQRTQRFHELAEPESWLPQRLFGTDLKPLEERVRIIADVPEIRLGKDEDVVFDASQVAAILRDWVNGETIEKMALFYSVSGNDRNKQIVDFSRYLFSILSRVSWGMSALEAVCLSESNPSGWSEIGYIPSMIFFGVRQKEAIWLRMVGIPRVVAPSLAHLWRERFSEEPDSYDVLRQWVSHLSDDEWTRAIPMRTQLTPADMRFIWHSISGELQTCN